MKTDREKKTMYISQKIIRLRKEAGWSQTHLSHESGITSAAMCQIEKGDRLPSLMVAAKLAEALNISLSELTGYALPSSSQINKEAQIFFRKFKAITKLKQNEQKIIKKLVDGLISKRDRK